MSKRINVMISDNLNERLDNFSERYGMSKSSIVGFVLGQWIDQMEKFNTVVYGNAGMNGLIAEMLNRINEKSNQK